MPTDSNGNYSLPASYHVQNGDTVLPVQHNPPFEDLAQAQTNRLMKDGRTVMTGDLQMGGNKVTGAADGEADTDVVTVNQIKGIAAHDFKTVALLLADTTLAYGSGINGVAEGEIVTAQGFRYEVAASDATDAHVETAGEVKLYALTENGAINVAALGATGIYEDDATDQIVLALSIARMVLFPQGHYRVSQTIRVGSYARLVGLIPQSSYNTGTSQVTIWGHIADLGNGGAIFECEEAGVASQSYVSENIQFRGDLEVDINNLAATSDQGVVAFDTSSAKNGLEFVQCSFRNLRHGVMQKTSSPYQDKTTFTRCHFNRNYIAVEGSPSAGLSFVDCFLYDNVQHVVSNNDVSLLNSSLNNSSFAGENSGVTGRTIVMIGGWTEGGNNLFRPSQHLTLEGVRCSETYSASGDTKFMISPQNDGVTIDWRGTRVPTNTRFINFNSVTDVSTITMRVFGAYGGAAFGNVSNINNYLTLGLNFEGKGNSNAERWNMPGSPVKILPNVDRDLNVTDIGKTLFRTTGGNSTLTIPANSSVIFAIGATFTVENHTGTGTLTVTTADTIRLGGSGYNSVTIPANAQAIFQKLQDTTWRCRATSAVAGV